MTADVPDRSPRADLRVSHAERDAAVERLREAAAEGRIELDELETRLEAALTARTHADLAPLTADLPPVVAAAPLVLKGGMHGAARTGRWEVPPRITAHGGMGGVKIDFTRTRCPLPEVLVDVDGQTAGVVIVVPDGWAVDSGGVDGGLGGLRDKTTPDRLPGTPLVRLSGTGGLGGVVVRHPNRWERRKLERNPPR
ncbi:MULTISPECIES: DUF1707 SHOCT-like domain-containing protein [Actinomadura]|uniref:DUF1707 SHOCT-like domain-containing protein n=1 Tax=Actinomadura TaxID=1988 RepID=UPI000402A28A|nr:MULTISPECIES: DUF1707 domain-containing protein [Actinomadura]RSN53372.1 DUF1707 and DUF2154 domain-containing protein [Actinomadura sp. WAC 06369]